ncbi:variable surface protein [Plasmodium gonderi]|uniref:Variable surface protein n=1 Tax=Plasmodium gonderi TaxID=77519 RepID=A0A1Y1JVJ1_PLAGO|nr:variable surface protein [Plasmodium gonderi]GAW84393.1 variable surface protein [Plasmodium gonderi]
MMREYMYNYVFSLFPQCEEIINICKHDNKKVIWENECEKIKNNILGIKDSKIQEICQQAMQYLSVIFTKLPYNTLDQAAFKYLYIWLRSYNLNEIGNKNIENFYKELIELYNNSLIRHSSSDVLYQHIDNVEIEELKYLYDMYKIVSFSKKKCEPDKNIEYCNVVINIIKTYNPQKLINNNQDCNPKVLHNSQNKIIVSIIIPIIVILAISLFLLVIHKFTPYGSYLRLATKMKRNESNNVYDKFNMMQSPEIYKNTSGNNSYNVLYNYA